MKAGFPGSPPVGNKTHKCLTWLKIANNETKNSVALLGSLISDLMDVEPSSFRLESYIAEGDPREQIKSALAKEGLTYQRGGYVVGAELTGPSKSLAELLNADGLSAVEAEYKRAYDRISIDPPAAITAASAILEAVCKHYLQSEVGTLPNKQTLSPLWTEVAKHLGLSPASVADDDLKRILTGLYSITDGIGALRTHEGSAHGHVAKLYKIDGRHARLAVHAAHTMAIFILETWQARNS
ncbi:abortive infection family protein [Xanthobacter sp. VTT E-85241]|uniref:abortive infection family protein n=1 Tax=Roseixanthobacter finlandensis TaxID=3119922 RepID=UPI00372C3084